MNILEIKNIYELEIAKFMHSFYHGLLPENFNMLAILNAQIHNTHVGPIQKLLRRMAIIWKELIRKVGSVMCI